MKYFPWEALVCVFVSFACMHPCVLQDPVPPELISVLQKSQDSLLHSLFADGDRESEGSRGHSKVITVVSKFKVQDLKSL